MRAVPAAPVGIAPTGFSGRMADQMVRPASKRSGRRHAELPAVAHGRQARHFGRWYLCIRANSGTDYSAPYGASRFVGWGHYKYGSSNWLWNGPGRISAVRGGIFVVRRLKRFPGSVQERHHLAPKAFGFPIRIMNWSLAQSRCHRSLHNQPAGVESRPATLRCFIHIRVLDASKGLFINFTRAFRSSEVLNGGSKIIVSSDPRALRCSRPRLPHRFSGASR